MLRLLHSTPLHPLSSSSSFPTKKKNSIFSYGFMIFSIDDEALSLKNRKRGYGNLCSINAVEQDSEFEVDPDKAREALRKLDEQLQSLSKKQTKTPKIRAVDLNRESSRAKEEALGFSGSFLVYVASALLIFTIFYNILFLTVIKPSIDGEEPVSLSSIMGDLQEQALKFR